MVIDYKEGFCLLEDYMGNNVYMDKDGYLVYKFKHPKYITDVVVGVRFNDEKPNIIDIYLEGIDARNGVIVFPELDGGILGLENPLTDYKNIHRHLSDTYGKEFEFNIEKAKPYSYVPVMKQINIKTGFYSIKYAYINDIDQSTTITYKFNKNKRNVFKIKIKGTLKGNTILLPGKVNNLNRILKDFENSDCIY